MMCPNVQVDVDGKEMKIKPGSDEEGNAPKRPQEQQPKEVSVSVACGWV